MCSSATIHLGSFITGEHILVPLSSYFAVPITSKSHLQPSSKGSPFLPFSAPSSSAASPAAGLHLPVSVESTSCSEISAWTGLWPSSLVSISDSSFMGLFSSALPYQPSSTVLLELRGDEVTACFGGLAVYKPRGEAQEGLWAVKGKREGLVHKEQNHTRWSPARDLAQQNTLTSGVGGNAEEFAAKVKARGVNGQVEFVARGGLANAEVLWRGEGIQDLEESSGFWAVAEIVDKKASVKWCQINNKYTLDNCTKIEITDLPNEVTAIRFSNHLNGITIFAYTGTQLHRGILKFENTNEPIKFNPFMKLENISARSIVIYRRYMILKWNGSLVDNLVIVFRDNLMEEIKEKIYLDGNVFFVDNGFWAVNKRQFFYYDLEHYTRFQTYAFVDTSDIKVNLKNSSFTFENSFDEQEVENQNVTFSLYSGIDVYQLKEIIPGKTNLRYHRNMYYDLKVRTPSKYISGFRDSKIVASEGCHSNYCKLDEAVRDGFKLISNGIEITEKGIIVLGKYAVTSDYILECESKNELLKELHCSKKYSVDYKDISHSANFDWLGSHILFSEIREKSRVFLLVELSTGKSLRHEIKGLREAKKGDYSALIVRDEVFLAVINIAPFIEIHRLPLDFSKKSNQGFVFSERQGIACPQSLDLHIDGTLKLAVSCHCETEDHGYIHQISLLDRKIDSKVLIEWLDKDLTSKEICSFGDSIIYVGKDALIFVENLSQESPIFGLSPSYKEYQEIDIKNFLCLNAGNVVAELAGGTVILFNMHELLHDRFKAKVIMEVKELIKIYAFEDQIVFLQENGWSYHEINAPDLILFKEGVDSKNVQITYTQMDLLNIPSMGFMCQTKFHFNMEFNDSITKIPQSSRFIPTSKNIEVKKGSRIMLSEIGKIEGPIQDVFISPENESVEFVGQSKRQKIFHSQDNINGIFCIQKLELLIMATSISSFRTAIEYIIDLDSEKMLISVLPHTCENFASTENPPRLLCEGFGEKGRMISIVEIKNRPEKAIVITIKFHNSQNYDSVQFVSFKEKFYVATWEKRGEKTWIFEVDLLKNCTNLIRLIKNSKKILINLAEHGWMIETNGVLYYIFKNSLSSKLQLVEMLKLGVEVSILNIDVNFPDTEVLDDYTLEICEANGICYISIPGFKFYQLELIISTFGTSMHVLNQHNLFNDFQIDKFLISLNSVVILGDIGTLDQNRSRLQKIAIYSRRIDGDHNNLISLHPLESLRLVMQNESTYILANKNEIHRIDIIEPYFNIVSLPTSNLRIKIGENGNYTELPNFILGEDLDSKGEQIKKQPITNLFSSFSLYAVLIATVVCLCSFLGLLVFYRIRTTHLRENSKVKDVDDSYQSLQLEKIDYSSESSHLKDN